MIQRLYFVKHTGRRDLLLIFFIKMVTHAICYLVFLTVLDFVSEEAIEDAWVIGTYLSDTDLLLTPSIGNLSKTWEAENVLRSAAASVAVCGVLFGNTTPYLLVCAETNLVYFYWLIHLQHQILSQRMDGPTGSSSYDPSILATELNPELSGLDRVAADAERDEVLNEDDMK